METIELLKKMISIPSFSGNEERVADLMVATWVEHDIPQNEVEITYG